MCTRFHTYEPTSRLRLATFNLPRIRETARIRRAVTQTICLYIEIRKVLRLRTRRTTKGWRTSSLSHSPNGEKRENGSRARARERKLYGISNWNVSKPVMWKRSVSVYVRLAPACSYTTSMMIRGAALSRRLQTHQPIRHGHELRGSFRS